MMNFIEIYNLLYSEFGEHTVLGKTDEIQPQVTIPAKDLKKVFAFLKSNSSTYFDMLSCITGVDNGIEAGTIDLIYHIYSIPFEHHLVVKTTLNRNITSKEPSIDSICEIYKAAEWHEREAYDFFGITFNQHPDLRRILLPSDWEGHPLRKDYKEQEYYRGIKVDNVFPTEQATNS